MNPITAAGYMLVIAGVTTLILLAWAHSALVGALVSTFAGACIVVSQWDL